jgi:hypothetical protein
LSLVDLDLREAVLVEEGEFQDSTLFRFERAKLELLPRLATSFPPLESKLAFISPLMDSNRNKKTTHLDGRRHGTRAQR